MRDKKVSTSQRRLIYGSDEVSIFRQTFTLKFALEKSKLEAMYKRTKRVRPRAIERHSPRWHCRKLQDDSKTTSTRVIFFFYDRHNLKNTLATTLWRGSSNREGVTVLEVVVFPQMKDSAYTAGPGLWMFWKKKMENSLFINPLNWKPRVNQIRNVWSMVSQLD